jgi:type I restriction enzyme R subunit
MLDTGIDVPEVLNLVFFKLVRSKTKFWQMLGRGTRLCPDLFGPGEDKRFFTVFDYCQNLEFFGENPETIEAGGTPSLATRLFRGRVDLICALDESAEPVATTQLQETARHGHPTTGHELRVDTAELLRNEVEHMNPDNFVVRPKRRLVERYAKPEAWLSLTPESAADLRRDLAGLPSELTAEGEEAKRFDLLLLNLQLAVLRHDPGFAQLRDRLQLIAERLAEKSNIPMVQPHMALILELQTEDWWQDVTAPMLEGVRRRLRDLIKLIDKRQRQIVYTDFEDEMGNAAVIELPGFTTADGFARFREKARQFLREHADHLSVRKLRTNAQLTPADLAELERMLAEAGIGSADDVQRAKRESQGLGLFVRSLVGMDREAAKEALGVFMTGKTLRANQIEFLDLIVDHLTENGTLEAARLYESPYTDFNALGVEGVFASAEVAELMAVLDEIRRRAA